MFRALHALALATALYGQPASAPYVGAAKCAQCHPSEARRQASSAHAAALFPIARHPLAHVFPSGPKLVRNPEYRYDFAFAPPDFRIRIRDAADVMELPVEWAFGAGRQAVTFVTRVNKDWYVEHYATYYPALRSYSSTPGQDVLRPTSLADAAGVVWKIHDPVTGIAECFQCHSTGPVSFDSAGVARLTELGVRCEACHDAGAGHSSSPSKNRMRNPGKLDGKGINEACGRCHRPPATTGVKIDWNYAWNVRHQPMYLNESRCFRESRGKLSCLTCHDPHEPAGQKRAADYNQKCGACHSKSNRSPKPICLAQTPANCVDCHMPAVSPQPPLRFAIHWIGVYGEGAKLKPLR